jgi:anionic cell wall polymer biosynthesis LytR-Cps2A-Psr (LCP) family protein
MKQKSKQRVEKLKMWWQLSIGGKVLNRVGRMFRSQRSGLTYHKQKKGSRGPGILSRVWNTLRFVFGRNRLGLKLLVAILVAVPLGFIALVISIQIHASPEAGDMAPTALYGDATNIALVVYEPNADYKFISYLGVLSWNPKDKQNVLMLINPDFGTTFVSSPTSKRTIKLRSLLANSATENQPGIANLMQSLRSLLAIPIDRYIAVSKSNAEGLIKQLGLNYIATDKVNDPDAGNFNVGDVVTGEKLWSYLAADSAGVNNRLQRISGYGKFQIESISNLGGMLKLLANSGSLFGSIETNLSKPELLDMMLTALSGLRVQTTYISNTEGVFVTDKLGGYISPNYASIDTKLQKVLARTDVVKEQSRIEIYNATATTGLATAKKRLIENLGGNVIRAATYTDKEERTKLYVKDVVRYKNTILAVQEALRGKMILVDQDFPQSHTGDMVLVVGNDNS